MESSKEAGGEISDQELLEKYGIPTAPPDHPIYRQGLLLRPLRTRALSSASSTEPTQEQQGSPPPSSPGENPPQDSAL